MCNKEQVEQLCPELRKHFTPEKHRHFADYLYRGRTIGEEVSIKGDLTDVLEVYCDFFSIYGASC